jgi:hypothetical protein
MGNRDPQRLLHGPQYFLIRIDVDKWEKGKQEGDLSPRYTCTADYFWGLKHIARLWSGRDKRFSSNSPVSEENFLFFPERIRSLHYLINTSSPLMFEGDPYKVRFTWANSVLPHEFRPGVFKYAFFQMYTHPPFVIIFQSYWMLYRLCTQRGTSSKLSNSLPRK